MRILTVNGIRTDGSHSTDVIGERLAGIGHDVIDINYPRVSIFTARSRDTQRENAEYILEQHQEGDAIIAHSYGCLLTLRAMEMGAKFDKVFFFGAAMNDDFTFPYHGMKSLLNIYNPEDRALSLGDLLAWHDFGNLGKTGYKGAPDERIIDVKSYYKPSDVDPMAHSFYFYEYDQLSRWTALIDLELQDV